MSKEDHLDEGLLETLRERERKTRGTSYKERLEDEKRAMQSFDGRSLRSAAAGAPPRAFQLNVRVRQEIKEMVHQVARRHRYSITEVIELAVEDFHVKTMKAAT